MVMDVESWAAATWGERLGCQLFLSGQIDALYEIAASTGKQAGVLNAHLYYLVRSGNYLTHRAEIDVSLAFLRQNTAKIADTWKVAALFGALHGDKRQIAAAQEAAEKTQFQKIRWIRSVGWKR